MHRPRALLEAVRAAARNRSEDGRAARRKSSQQTSRAQQAAPGRESAFRRPHLTARPGAGRINHKPSASGKAFAMAATKPAATERECA